MITQSITGTTKKVIGFVKLHWLALIAILIVVILQLIHLINATRNVPLMDDWRILTFYTEKILNGNMTLSDYWNQPDTPLKNPLNTFLNHINIRFFHFNTQFGIFAGLVVQSGLIFLLFKLYRKTMPTSGKADQLMFIPIILAVFNFGQWEILTLNFSLLFMLRISVYIIIFYWIDRSLIGLPSTKKQLAIAGVCTGLAILFLSGQYSPGFALAVGLSLLICFIINYNKDRLLYIKNYSVFLGVTAVAASLYLLWAPMAKGAHSGFNGLLMVKGILVMLGSSLNYFTWGAESLVEKYYAQSFFSILIYITAIFLYFKAHMYKKTFFPLFLIIYSLVNCLAISYARSAYGEYYMSSSRYICETTLGFIGIMWIFSYTFITGCKNGKTTTGICNCKNISIFTTSALACIFSIFMLMALVREWKIAPFRGASFDYIKTVVQNIDDYSDDKLSVLQADSVIYSRQGAALLKKYRLSFFQQEKKIYPNDISMFNDARLLEFVDRRGSMETPNGKSLFYMQNGIKQGWCTVSPVTFSVSPLLDVENPVLHIKFSHISSKGDGLNVLIGCNNSGQLTVIDSFFVPSLKNDSILEWNTRNIRLPLGTKNLVIKVYSETGDQTADWLLWSDFSIENNDSVRHDNGL